MSQNGAKNMAQRGMTSKDIIGFFYPGVELKTLQFGE
jgi:peptidoglycan hydrolase-like amidase